MILVSDTNPLIILAKIDRLALLKQLFGEVQIPPAVYRELTAKSGPEQSRINAALTDFLQVGENLQLAPEVVPLVVEIDEGEQQAVNLAYKLQAPLLIDDRRGRRAASRCGVMVTGVAGLFLMAKDAHLIPLVEPPLQEARTAGYWIDDQLLADVLRLAGEGK